MVKLTKVTHEGISTRVSRVDDYFTTYCLLVERLYTLTKYIHETNPIPGAKIKGRRSMEVPLVEIDQLARPKVENGEVFQCGSICRIEKEL